MTLLLILAAIAFLIGVSVFLWKSGFLFDAERPRRVIEQAVKDPKERRAALTRISRWRAEGRISREEAERWTALCEENWDLNSDPENTND